MNKFFVIKFGLVATLLSGSTYVQARPSIDAINGARARVLSMKVKFERVIAGRGAETDRLPGPGRPTRPACSTLRTPGQCAEFGCRWVSHGRFGQCVDRAPVHHRPHFHPQNDIAAQLASAGMSLGMQKLADDMLQMASNYYNNNFNHYWKKACERSKDLLMGNQGAKLAAALPDVGNILPQYFDFFDQEIIATRSMLWCN